MPQVAPIVLTDGTSTATFNPQVVKPGAESSFADRSAGSKYLESGLTISSRDGGNDSTVVRMKIEIPLIQINSDTGESEVVETAIAEVKFRHPAVATKDDRDLLVAYTENAMANSQALIGPVLRGDEGIY